MKTSKRTKIITKLIGDLHSFNNVYDKSCDLFLNFDSPLGNEIMNIQNGYINSVSEIVGDNDDWILWYIFDNRLGKYGLDVTINNITKKISNVDDLVWAIENDIMVDKNGNNNNK